MFLNFVKIDIYIYIYIFKLDTDMDADVVFFIIIFQLRQHLICHLYTLFATSDFSVTRLMT